MEDERVSCRFMHFEFNKGSVVEKEVSNRDHDISKCFLLAT